MRNTGNRQPALRVHRCHAAKAGRAHGRAVIGIFAGDDMGFFRLAKRRPIVAHKADIGVIGI